MHMPTPRKANPLMRGRKPIWRNSYLEQAKKLATLGATDVEMADFLGVSLRTFMHWKMDNPEFLHALKAGKDVADARVERRLYERAIGGFKTSEMKAFVIKGKVITVELWKEHPPDTTACIFWLKNRQGENWRDRVDPGLAATRFNFIGMLPTEEEWIAQYGSHQEPLTIAAPAQVIEDDDAGDAGLD
jgi:hypothetical protein